MILRSTKTFLAILPSHPMSWPMLIHPDPSTSSPHPQGLLGPSLFQLGSQWAARRARLARPPRCRRPGRSREDHWHPTWHGWRTPQLDQKKGSKPAGLKTRNVIPIYWLVNSLTATVINQQGCWTLFMSQKEARYNKIKHWFYMSFQDNCECGQLMVGLPRPNPAIHLWKCIRSKSKYSGWSAAHTPFIFDSTPEKHL